MEKIENLIQGFLSQKRIAILGVSDKRETGCNFNYKKFKENGYKVYPVNPHISSFNGETCYPDLKSIPEKSEAVFMLTSPAVTEQIVRECFDLRIKYVWIIFKCLSY